MTASCELVYISLLQFKLGLKVMKFLLSGGITEEEMKEKIEIEEEES